jgi:hypothetical protein
MKEFGKQCTVVFALIATELASECVWRGAGGLPQPPPPPTSRFRNNLCKDDSALFSRLLQGNFCFWYRYDNGDVKVWDLRQMKECWETTVGRCLSILYTRAGIFKKSMGARNRGGIGLSNRPARLRRLAEYIPWNRFRGPIHV